MSILKKDDMQAAGRTCMKWNLRCFYVFWWSLTRFRSTLICKGEKVKVWLWQVMYSHQVHLHCRLIFRVDRKKSLHTKVYAAFFPPFLCNAVEFFKISLKEEKNSCDYVVTQAGTSTCNWGCGGFSQLTNHNQTHVKWKSVHSCRHLACLIKAKQF